MRHCARRPLEGHSMRWTKGFVALVPMTARDPSETRKSFNLLELNDDRPSGEGVTTTLYWTSGCIECLTCSQSNEAITNFLFPFGSSRASCAATRSQTGLKRYLGAPVLEGVQRRREGWGLGRHSSVQYTPSTATTHDIRRSRNPSPHGG